MCICSLNILYVTAGLVVNFFTSKMRTLKVLGLNASNSRERFAIVGKKVYCISEFVLAYVFA